jgi:hypothetical protein
MTDGDLSLLTDEELRVWEDRAYVESARSWREARSAPGSIRGMLTQSAVTAERFWRALKDERVRRVDRSTTA